MKCFSDDILISYANGNLKKLARTVVGMHLIQCDMCHNKIIQYRRATQRIVTHIKRFTLMKMSAEAQISPTVDTPSERQLSEWSSDVVCDATDGCVVEHDGVCPHGHPSWLKYLGLV